jgi:hypothetical protein
MHPNGSTVYHLRLHIPFLPNIYENTAAAYQKYGRDCLLSVPQAQRLAVSRTGVRMIWAQPDLAQRNPATGDFAISDDAINAFSEIAATLLLRQTDAKGVPLGTTPAQIADTMFANMVRTLNGTGI